MDSTDQQLSTLLRRSPSGERHRKQRTLAGKGCDALKRGTPDELRLVHLDCEIQSDLRWSRIEIGVLPDQDVSLLETKKLERVEPVRPDVEGVPCIEIGRASCRERVSPYV